MSTDTRFKEILDDGVSYEDVRGSVFQSLLFACSIFGLVMIVLLIYDVVGMSYEAVFVHGMDPIQFLTQPGSRSFEKAGFYSVMVGSAWLMILVAFMAFFIGVGTAVYLEEFAADNRWTRLFEANLANLAGVPSVVYGLVILALLVNGAGWGPILLAGAVALALLVMPIIIVASIEALRAVPDGVRQGSAAAGATQWQTVRNVVLPAAMPGIMTGTILALARAIGETAPLIMVGALFITTRTPSSPFDSFGAMPTEIYTWAAQPELELRALAGLGILVLLTVLFLMQGTAVYIRRRYEVEFGE